MAFDSVYDIAQRRGDREDLEEYSRFLREKRMKEEYAETGREMARCQNCNSLWWVDTLSQIDDVFERVMPRETMPPGQCPDEDCGALCQFVEAE